MDRVDAELEGLDPYAVNREEARKTKGKVPSDKSGGILRKLSDGGGAPSSKEQRQAKKIIKLPGEKR